MKLVVVALVVVAACADPRALSGPCDGADCTPSVHPAGIADPTSPDFHGTKLRELNWDFSICAGCHGADFRGGSAGVSCYGCHTQGPTACVTCHGDGPTSNAHPFHAGAGVDCGECHVVPKEWNADGHILHDGVAITAPAKVTFGAKANWTIDPADRAGPASFDPSSQQCSNVYCHGAALHQAGGLASTLAWTDPTPPGTCDRCHGNPPPSHARTDCATCHPKDAPHIDGVVQVGRVAGCSGCHGGPASPAPPVDLSGNTFTTALGVGAHQAHLQAQSHISSPIACATCHEVPATVDSPGHIDSAGPARVDPSLGWNRTSQTCTAWCHGPSQPVWTSTGQVTCGSCHGVPPDDGVHAATLQLTDCATCHTQTIDSLGNLIVHADGTSEHINGIVDF